jgi:pilus assembly protein CpaB
MAARIGSVLLNRKQIYRGLGEEVIVSRITPGTVIVGIFAVLFGLIGAYGVRKYLQGSGTPPPAATQPRREIVPLASMDIPAGRQVVLGEVALLQLVPDQIRKMRADNKLPAQYMNNPQQIIGRILKKPVKKGDAFQTDFFYPEGTGPTVAEKLTPGLRAVTIPVEGTGALGGFDGPGSYVDIVFRSRADEDVGIPETTVTLLEGVQVLAMEQESARVPPGTSLQNRVTLAVTAEQANALKIAEGRGTFSLSLRNPDDVEIATISVPQTLDRLLNVPVRDEHITAIYRGGGAAQAVSFPGAVVTPQPAVALPIAGVLQMRAAQQTTSVDKPASQSAPPTKSYTSGAAAASGSERSESVPAQPASPPDSAAAGTPTPATDDSATVTVQIPVSVLLQEVERDSTAEDSAETPPVRASEAVPPQPDKASEGSTTAADTRPRKLLSDIGRNRWEQPASRRFPN